MAKTRPGIERITRQDLRALVARSKLHLDAHVMQCEKCAHAGSDVYDHCATWWGFMTNLHKARRRLRRIEAPEIQGLDPLFDWPERP